MDHWASHARFEDVASRIEDSLVCLFDPKMPYFKPRILLRCIQDIHHIYPACFYDQSDNMTPLFLAAFCGFSGLAKHLIITHALDVNAGCVHDITPLHGASSSRQVDLARVLLDNGAHMNAQDSCNFTPLHYASSHGHLKVAHLLLERGANSKGRTNEQDTPLCKALQYGYLKMVRVLLDHRVDVTIQGRRGLTPYQIATENQHRDIAQLLSEHRAERK